jgi:hypothetical protein
MSTKPLRVALPWRDLYMAAIFEADRTQLRARISQAEKALVLRERELFAIADPSSEKQAVNNALNALRALRYCHGLK